MQASKNVGYKCFVRWAYATIFYYSRSFIGHYMHYSVPHYYPNIGDSPARAFEAGNQINGHFPCLCGADARKFMTYANLQEPKYLTLEERMTVINKTSRWRDRKSGTLSVYDNLDVSVAINLKLQINSTLHV